MMKILKKEIIEGLKDLASYDFQKASWSENSLDLCWSYSETVSSVYEDGTGLSDALQANVVVFSKAADLALRKLENACDAIGYSRDEKEIIDSQEMKAVRDMAKNCLSLIKASDLSESQVQFIETQFKPSKISFPDRDNL